jgi:hypothetical protein
MKKITLTNGAVIESGNVLIIEDRDGEGREREFFVSTDKDGDLVATCLKEEYPTYIPLQSSGNEWNLDYVTKNLLGVYAGLAEGVNGWCGSNVKNQTKVLWKRNPIAKIRLTDDYTVEVQKGATEIVVGCQTIPVDKIREVLRAVEGEDS